MKTKLVTWAGAALSVGVIVVLLSVIDFPKALAAVREADLVWALTGGALYCTLFLLRGWRWTILLRPLQRISIKETTEVFLIGVMANNILPARLGDVARAFVLARRVGIPASATFSNVMLERVFDGVAVVALLNFVLWTAPPPDASVRSVAWLTTAIFVGAITVAAVVTFQEERVMRLVKRLAGRWPTRAEALLGFVQRLATGLHTLKSPGQTFQVAALSLLVWVLEAVVYFIVQRALGLEVPFLGMLAVMSLLTLGLTAPSGPGFVGVFEGVIVWALGLYAVEEPRAMAFALVLHVIHYVPGTLAGLGLAWRNGLKIREIKAAAQNAAPSAPAEVGEGASAS